ncbi:MAG: hypothetical protein KDA91_09910, partial [Planctomycetaceae bacterium]|nr:hypothetical protein [Planctomycetaceae bacterium]
MRSGGASGNNMVLVTFNEYDDGQDGGDGNLTRAEACADSVTFRETSFEHDFRNRQTAVIGEENACSVSVYDNLSRVIQRESRWGSSTGTLLSKSVTKFDDRGRVYQAVAYAVNPSTGATGNSLTSNNWYDAGGNLIKSLPAGSDLFSNTTYDILGRATHQYSGYDLDETTYAEAETVVGDTIMEQQEMTYNQVGSVLSTASKQRYHDAAAKQTGALGNPSTTPKARVTYAASWFDGVGRAVASADYGTNGGTALSRPSTVPTRSDTILVNSTVYNSEGEVESTFDPKNTETRFEYDDAGRQTAQIENYISGSSGWDKNRTTWTSYTADGQVETLTASNGSTGNQQTVYYYGTTLADSSIASSRLLVKVAYPDAVIATVLSIASCLRCGIAAFQPRASPPQRQPPQPQPPPDGDGSGSANRSWMTF